MRMMSQHTYNWMCCKPFLLQVLSPLRRLTVIITNLTFQAVALKVVWKWIQTIRLNFSTKKFLFFLSLTCHRYLPCIIRRKNLYFLPRITCPKYCSFHPFIVISTNLSLPILLNTSKFVTWLILQNSSVSPHFKRVESSRCF